MKYLSALVALLIAVPAFAQSPSAMDLFQKGLEYYNADHKDSAIMMWQQVVARKAEVDPATYGSAMFNIPTVYWQLKQYEKAKEGYLQVLASDLRDDEPRQDLMEPHANYKHNSAVSLARLSIRDSNYAEALRWLERAETVYPYWGFEGSATSVSEEAASILSGKVFVLRKAGRTGEAVREIVLALIHSRELEGFFDESAEELFAMIDSSGGRKNFRAEFDAAISSVVVTSQDQKNYVASFRFRELDYTINITRVYPDRNIPHYWKTLFAEDDVDRKYVVDYIKERSFYTKLSE